MEFPETIGRAAGSIGVEAGALDRNLQGLEDAQSIEALRCQSATTTDARESCSTARAATDRQRQAAEKNVAEIRLATATISQFVDSIALRCGMHSLKKH
jgi:hypothetical protein